MPSLRRRLLRRWVPFAVLVAGLAVTGVLTWFVLRTTREADIARFQTTADEARHLIEIRLNTYVELLRACGALFAASADVTPGEFRAFVMRLQVGDRYPGIQGRRAAHPRLPHLRRDARGFVGAAP
jgi:CHASE1-domain containing sensor protein